MSFTLPVGNFTNLGALYRPASVADTPGAGTITNSAKAYDGDVTSFGTWASTASGTVYSVYTFSGATVITNTKLFARVGANLGRGIGLAMSIDGGATYPYSTCLSGNSDGLMIDVVSIVIPNITVISNVKAKIIVSPHVDHIVVPTTGYVYDIYIQ
jgi:hypothetical protein